MRKITALFVASTLALGAVNLAYAADTQPADGKTVDAPAKHHKGGRDGEHGMFKGLNLTDAQKQQVRTIMQEENSPIKDSWQEDRRSMHDIVTGEHFDKTKAQAQVDKMAENDKARMLSHLEKQNKIYNILTPEQKKQFNDKFERRLTEHSARQDKMASHR